MIKIQFCCLSFLLFSLFVAVGKKYFLPKEALSQLYRAMIVNHIVHIAAYVDVFSHVCFAMIRTNS